MDAERWRQVEDVLDRALDSDPARWPAIVSEACGTDTELRREVEQLLAEYSRPAPLLADGPAAIVADLARRDDAPADDPLVGTQLGAWRVVRQIGRGGMSRVFLGERSDGTFEQKAAIKVLRAGLDTPAEIERFRIERQILASLDHPNIARLLDGGVAPDGRPYLVLEHVEGEPLTAYCDGHGLGVPARLRLFLAVAEAIESAHRQLVVHRDLKPSNILVGADGRPRLLDFGVAKILDPSPGRPQQPTVTRRRWMTPEYAAPEQFSGAPVTTATDVYQLGAVLYELLSGRRVFELTETDGASLEERVLGEDPPAPSTHRRELRGDLDAIVLRALRKEPAARYASVGELAADVRRYLAAEPVQARAGDRAYRWRRLARKRALPIAIAAAAALAVAGYAATVSVQNRRIAAALAAANVEREKSDQVTAFVLGLFRATNPQEGRGDTLTARALLQEGEARASALAAQPAVQAELLELIGRARLDLGALADARPSLERALAIRRRVLPDSHPDVAQSIATLARLDEMDGRYDDAVRGYQEALNRLRATPGDTAAPTQWAMFNLASALHRVGQAKEARPLFDQWERAVAARPPRRDAEYADALESLGLYLQMGAVDTAVELRRAERHYREALDIWRDLFGPDHGRYAYTEHLLAEAVWRQGRQAEAEPMMRDAIGRLRALYPGGHPDLDEALVGFGGLLAEARRFDEALPVLRASIELAVRYNGPDHISVTNNRAQYGDALRLSGDHAAAEPILREAEARYARDYGPRSLLLARTRIFRADALRGLGRFREAEALLLTTWNRLLDERGMIPMTVRAGETLATLYDETGRAGDAARVRGMLPPNASPAARAGR